MGAVDVATLFYLACFQACGWPQIVRILKRKQAADLSIWREILIIAGCCAQLYVMAATDADWRIVVGPFGTLVSLAILTAVIVKHRGKAGVMCYLPKDTPT